MKISGLLFVMLLLLPHTLLKAQSVPVLMLSDIHLDPFRDPAKFKQLEASPASEWPQILGAATSATQQQDFAKLNVSCPVRGVDSSWNLVQESLAASKREIAKPTFVTISGDLMAHGFDCRYRALGGKPEQYAAFAAKTVDAVAIALEKTFPETPIYMALGNNDSGCGDYREAESSAFLHQTAVTAARLSRGDVAQIEKDASPLGDWSVSLPRPFEKARLLVMQNIFEAGHYARCGGGNDKAEAAEQVKWLRRELAEARRLHEQVWVMAHIPPGIDMYSTLTRGGDVCEGASARSFLADNAMTDALTEYADVVQLGLFAHTHMDEMHVLGKGEHTVAIRLVPSISPVNGNLPALTVAQVETKSFRLKDWSVYVAPNAEGKGEWTQEYSYSHSFQQPMFSAREARMLLDGFVADKTSAAASTQAYQRHFFAGDNGMHTMLIRLAWPLYACGAVSSTTDEYRSCECQVK